MEITKDQINRGQAIYTPINLFLYDFVVLKVSNSFIWKCPTRKINKLFKENLTKNHLDVGVGTGTLLIDNITDKTTRIGLLDINSTVLETASNRLRKKGFTPEIIKADVFEVPTPTMKPFSSVSANYLFHCIPGSPKEKVNSFFNCIAPLVEKNATVFGSTICCDLDPSRPAKLLMKTYQDKGIFNNQADTLDELTSALSEKLDDFFCESIGSVLLFRGKIS